MSERDHYPAGVPCWVTVLQEDVPAAQRFYGPLFGWDFVGPQEPEEGSAPYLVARMRGRDVAGIGTAPDGVPPAWITEVRVDSAQDAAGAAAAAGGALLAGPMDLPPAGRLSVLSDPAGAVFCAFEAGSREGVQVVNEAGAWAMSSLHTGDPEVATRFYATVFGWQPEPFGPPEAAVTLWRLPGYVGGEPQQPVPRDVVAVMSAIPEGADIPPHWNVNFWVADTDATAAHAAQLGGQVLLAPHDTPGFRNAVLVDPQGATFSISQLMLGQG